MSELFPWSSRINLVPFRTFTTQTSNLSGTIYCRFLQQTGSSVFFKGSKFKCQTHFLSHYYFEMKAVKLDGSKVLNFIRYIWKTIDCGNLKLKNSATLLALTSTLNNVTSPLEFLNVCIWHFWIKFIYSEKATKFLKSSPNF